MVAHWGGPGRATTGRSRTTASRSTPRATCGSAATAATTVHILKFTQDGKFLMQIGSSDQSAGSNDIVNFSKAAEDRRRSSGERSVRVGRLRQPAASIVYRHGHRQVQAATGAPTATSPTTRNARPLQPRRAARAAVPHPGALRRARRRTACVYVCDRAERSHPGVQEGRHVREGGVRRRRTRAATDRCGTSRSRRIRSRSTSTSPTASNEKIYVIAARFARSADQLRRRRPPARPVLRRAQHRHRLEGQHLHRPRPTAASVCRSSSTRASAPVTKPDQGVVWPKTAKSPL